MKMYEGTQRKKSTYAYTACKRMGVSFAGIRIHTDPTMHGRRQQARHGTYRHKAYW
jgi:hypothetical protein